MAATLNITVKQRTTKGQTSLEGSYQLPSSSPAKLSRKDGSTQFPNRSTLNQAANRLATTLGWEVQFNEPAKKAAKKSVKSKTATKAKPKAKKTSAPAQTAPATSN
jgi:hypothetical protein